MDIISNIVQRWRKAREPFVTITENRDDDSFPWHRSFPEVDFSPSRNRRAHDLFLRNFQRGVFDFLKISTAEDECYSSDDVRTLVALLDYYALNIRERRDVAVSMPSDSPIHSGHNDIYEIAEGALSVEPERINNFLDIHENLRQRLSGKKISSWQFLYEMEEPVRNTRIATLSWLLDQTRAPRGYEIRTCFPKYMERRYVDPAFRNPRQSLPNLKRHRWATAIIRKSGWGDSPA